MATQRHLFIRSEHRPDLRALFDRDANDPTDAADVSCFASFPRSYTFSGCNEKSDKADKTKEVGKDDKSNRAPVKDRAMRVRDGRALEAATAESMYATVFA